MTVNPPRFERPGHTVNEPGVRDSLTMLVAVLDPGITPDTFFRPKAKD